MEVIGLIEDTPDSAEFLQILIQKYCGINDIHWFHDGKEFLATFKENSFKVILLDICLPELDGFDVLKSLRKIDKKVPVIAISALSPSDVKGRVAGFAAYVTKPILDFDRFRALLYSHIGKAVA